MERILELAELAIQVNEESKHHVMCEIEGHVKGVYIRGYIDGYERGKGIGFAYHFYWDRDFTKEYEEVKQFLLVLLEEQYILS